MPALKYTYFNVKGRGETVRLLLAAGGMRYEDKRVEFAEWPALKPKTLWGTLPILEVDGKSIGQSMAIARYVAREGGFVGKNSFEQAQVEALVDQITDMRETLFGIKQKPETEQAQAMKDFGEKTLANVLPKLEALAAANKEKPGVFIGGKMTIADVHFFSVFEILMGKMPTALAAYPNLKKIFDGVAANPKIAEYIKKRPQTPF